MSVVSPTLVGRDGEFATLRGALDAATAGTGGMVFVCGEPGIGKSRLVREAAIAARHDGFVVCTGRAVPDARRSPFRPLAEAFLPHLRDTASDHRDLAAWLPALSALLPSNGTPAASSIAAPMHAEAVIRLLRWLRGGAPGLLLILEDLHWADPDTLDVLEYLTDNLVTEQTVCVATVRVVPHTLALDLAHRAGQRGAAEVLSLRRLPDEAVGRLVTACAPSASAEVIERVRAIADGVPLLVEELLATDGVPTSIEDAVRVRMEPLPPVDRLVLAAAAVQGRDFDWRLLSESTELTDELVTDALERLVDLALIQVDGDEFRFRHALTREAVLTNVIPPRRARLAAATYAALHRSQPELRGRALDRAADLALQAGDRAAAGELFATRGMQAARDGALGSAVEALRQAADLLEDPYEVRRKLVETLALAGRLDEALAVGHPLVERLTPADATDVHLQLARAAVAATRWTVAAQHLARARALMPDGAPATSTALAAIIDSEIAAAGDDADRSRRAARLALDIAELAGLADLTCHALQMIGRGERQHDLDAAHASFNRALDIAERAHLPVWRLHALHELGTIEMLDHAGTRSLRAALALAEEMGARATVVTLDVQLAAGYELSGDTELSLARAQRAVERAARWDLGDIRAIAHVMLGCCQALRGNQAAVVETATAARRLAPGNVEVDGLSWAGITGMYELVWGSPTAAMAAMDRGVALLQRSPHSAPGPYRALWPLVVAAAGRPGAATAAAAASESGIAVNRANRGLLHYAEAVRIGPVDPTGAEAELSAGDHDLDHAPVWRHLGRALAGLAAGAAGWGRPEQWVREASAALRQLGLDPVDRWRDAGWGASADTAGTEMARPRRSRRWAVTGVTDREADVLALVVRGLANKDIAAELHLSPRTVEKHMESLLRKAGASSRTHLVAMAAHGGPRDAADG